MTVMTEAMIKNPATTTSAPNPNRIFLPRFRLTHITYRSWLTRQIPSTSFQVVAWIVPVLCSGSTGVILPFASKCPVEMTGVTETYWVSGLLGENVTTTIVLAKSRLKAIWSLLGGSWYFPPGGGV